MDRDDYNNNGLAPANFDWSGENRQRKGANQYDSIKQHFIRKGESWMYTLKDAKVGKKVKVKKLQGEGAVRRRIMDMGITKGVEIYIRKVAPLGDPIEIFVRGYELTLRKADAEMVELED